MLAINLQLRAARMLLKELQVPKKVGCWKNIDWDDCHWDDACMLPNKYLFLKYLRWTRILPGCHRRNGLEGSKQTLTQQRKVKPLHH